MSFYNGYSDTQSNARGHRHRHPSPNDLHRSHSFIVDDADEYLRKGLRKKSFIGDTPHPILHQLSEEGKVNIPVEHIPDKRADDLSHVSTTTYPEVAQSQNYAKNSKFNTASGVTKKTSPVRTSTSTTKRGSSAERKSVEHFQPDGKDYNAKNYQERQLFNNNSFDFKPSSNYETNKLRMVSGHDDDEFESDLSSRGSTKACKKEREKDHLKEVKYQDDFMQEKSGLHRFLIIPDGNCLYRAVAQACLLDQTQHSVLRQLAVDHIRERKDEFKELVEGDMDVFLAAAQRDGEWAGYPEILALSRVLDININITTGGSPGNPKVQIMSHHFEPSGDDKKRSKAAASESYIERDSIWLSWLSSGHYDTFAKKGTDNPSYDEWLASKQSRIESDAAIANKLHMDDLNKVEQLRRNRYENDSGRDVMPSSPPPDYWSATQQCHMSDSNVPPHVYPNSTRSENSANRAADLSASTLLDREIAMALRNDEYDQLCDDLARNHAFDYA